MVNFMLRTGAKTYEAKGRMPLLIFDAFQNKPRVFIQGK